ncbi:nudC domain-containing protein 3 [Lycorma delicatula]|uniref:nudC domain-containing protein 3 n=1 Tax=Lycorma delicatula TaxID=130591 RepID=UPI003F51A586
MDGKYDDLIARILEEEREIYPFLDVIFGFLWRRTDFFVIKKEGGKLGFPPGGAEKIVQFIFRKWQNSQRIVAPKSSISKENECKNVKDFPHMAQKEVVVTSEDVTTDNITTERSKGIKSVETKKNVCASDIYNGADRGTYRWSQTVGELDVIIPVPECIKKSKEVDVLVTDSKLSVKIKDQADPTGWKSLVDGELSYKVNKEDSIWSLSPGQQISIHWEKSEERWWDAVLTSEPKLDTKKLDASRPMTELSEEEQMKVEELMWNEERKQLGLKTSEQLKAEKILKDAWNIEGSPFKGTKFDPSVLDFNTNAMNFQGNG